jgi:hypothetical protein
MRWPCKHDRKYISKGGHQLHYQALSRIVCDIRVGAGGGHSDRDMMVVGYKSIKRMESLSVSMVEKIKVPEKSSDFL